MNEYQEESRRSRRSNDSRNERGKAYRPHSERHRQQNRDEDGLRGRPRARDDEDERFDWRRWSRDDDSEE